MSRRYPAVLGAVCLSLIGSIAIFPASGEAAPPFYQAPPLPYQHYGYVPRSYWQRQPHPPSGYGSRLPAPSAQSASTRATDARPAPRHGSSVGSPVSFRPVRRKAHPRYDRYRNHRDETIGGARGE
jgi:hypothetical protein